MKADKETIKRLQYLIDKDGSKPYVFAKKIKAHNTVLYRILKGELGIGDSMLKKICDYTNVEPSWLLYGLQKDSSIQKPVEIKPNSLTGMKQSISDEEIIKDIWRFIRHQAMRSNCMQDKVIEIIKRELNGKVDNT